METIERATLYKALTELVRQANATLKERKDDKRFIDGNTAAAYAGTLTAVAFMGKMLAMQEERQLGEVLIDFGFDATTALAIERTFNDREFDWSQFGPKP